jgi:hypothetical protein
VEVEEDGVGLFARCLGQRQAGLAVSNRAWKNGGTLPSFPVGDALRVTGCIELATIAQRSPTKAITVRGRGGLQGCEMLRIPHWLDSRLTEGGKVFSLTYQPRSTPQKHYFSASGTNFV